MYWLNPGGNLTWLAGAHSVTLSGKDGEKGYRYPLPRSSIHLLGTMGLCSKRGKPAQVPVPQPLLIGWRPDQSACATSSRFLSWEATWKNQVLNVSAQFPEIYPAASWEETQGTVCDLTDYRAQIRAHLSISGWPPRRAKGHSNCHVPPADMNSTRSSLTTVGRLEWQAKSDEVKIKWDPPSMPWMFLLPLNQDHWHLEIVM